MEVNIDLSYLENMSGGDKGLMKEMIEIFKEQVPEFVTDMKRCLETENWKNLASVAHKAKSSIAIIGITKLTEELKVFENKVLQEKETSTYSDFIILFEKTCYQAIIQLDTIISTY